MIGEETAKDSPGDGRMSETTRGVAPWLAFCAAGAALGGSLWAALGSAGCGGCRAAGELAAGVPLAWAGAGFYAGLMAATAWGGSGRWVRTGFYAASGVHVVLLIWLAGERMFCPACVLTGMAALAGGVVSLAARPRAGRWAAVVFGVAELLTLGGVMTMGAVEERHQALVQQRLLAGEGPAKAGVVKLVVYEREGCKHCLEFEENLLPRLEAALGGALVVERYEAELDMESPTIVVVGKPNRVFQGVPEYAELEKAVREVQKE